MKIEKSSLRIYVYFYYEIILNPQLNSEGRVILSDDGSSKRFCESGANAILVSYKGNGTSMLDCLHLEDSKVIAR